MSEWVRIKLSDCCASIVDGDHQSMPVTDNGIPFVIISDIKDNRIDFSNTRFVPNSYYESLDNKRKPEKGDVLYSVKGSFGIPVFVTSNRPFTFQRDIAILKCNEKIDSQFLYYVLKSDYYYRIANSLAIGSAQRAITLKTLKNIEIPCPGLNIQRKVASILSAYDSLIETNQRQIKLLEEAAQRLYKEWFVDLRYPGHENVPVVDGVPEGWVRKTMADICQAIGGGTPSTAKKEYYESGTIRWVTPTDLTKSGSWILLDTEKKITKDGLDNCSAKMLPPYTILMTSRASIGYIAICKHEVCTNQGFISCVPFDEKVRYYLMLNLLNRVDELKSKATGSTFLEIAKRTFRELEIITPSEETIISFNKVVIPLIRKMELIRQQNESLSIARDRLLPKLMSGEIAV